MTLTLWKNKHLLQSLGIENCKTILEASDKLIFIIKEKQFKCRVDGSIPVLIKSVNWLETAEEIDDLFLGDAEVWRRPAIGYAGPLGGDFPLVTKEGHNIPDVIFTSPMEGLVEVAKNLAQIDGVVEHGVIFKKPCTAIIASDNGLLQVVDSAVRMESSNLK